jgi:hypothetical protein
VPEISRFYGIVVKMYLDDHSPAHIHAVYAEHEAVICIESLAVLRGRLPARALGLLVEWIALHQQELLVLWHRAMAMQPLYRIEPLP